MNEHLKNQLSAFIDGELQHEVVLFKRLVTADYAQLWRAIR
jgi:negative regulator of sigma E activity